MDTLISTVFSNALIALLLGFLAWGAGKLFRNAALSHAIWLLVLVKLVTPPIVLLPLPIALNPAIVDYERMAPDGYANNAIANLTAQGKDRAAPFLVLWGLGSAAFFLLLGIRVHRFRKLIKYEYSPDPGFVSAARRLSSAIGLKHCPRITCVPGRLSPLVWGFAGRVIIPGSLLEQLSDEGRESLLAHELAHIRRRDHWARFAVVLATGLFWWHPIVWLAGRRIREAQELCCDALVMDLVPGGTAGYAGTLLDVADFLAEAASPYPFLGVGFGQAKSLRRRLTMIMRGTSKTKVSSLGKLMILVFAMVVLPLAFSQSQEKTKTVPDQEKKPNKLALEIKQNILDAIHDINIREIVRGSLRALRAVHVDEINSEIQEALSEMEIERIRGAIEISDDALKDVHIELEGLHDVLKNLKIELKGLDVELKDMEIAIKEQIREALRDVKIKKEIKPNPKVPPSH
jgi:beta-lactamase regulating signal transducer with metallopeptidase domain